jgi:hypothetical protein
MNKQMMGVYSVRERDKGRKAVWTRVGVAWPHAMGDGFNIELEALPLNFDGKLIVLAQRNWDGASAEKVVVLPPRDKVESADDNQDAA